MRDLVRLCCFTNFTSEDICQVVPAPATDAIFTVDMGKVNEADLTCDDSGSYTNNSSPTAIVRDDK